MSQLFTNAKQPDKGQSSDRKGPPATPGDPNAISSLTARECEVLVALSTAASNREISRKLGIAERTVKAHLTKIMSKISVSCRTEAALFAYVHHSYITRHGDACTAA
ncbi:response regulator transcription factor [Streptomyces sp. NPDC001340]